MVKNFLLMAGDRRNSSLWIMVLSAAATLLVTWAARRWVERRLPIGEPQSIIGEWARLTHGENSGVAFSLLRNSPVVPWLSLAALVAVIVLLARPLYGQRGAMGLVGLILGGGTANLLDRIDDGRVTDYIDLGIGAWRYATFNLPDTAIVSGIVLLLWLMLRREQHHRQRSTSYPDTNLSRS